METTFRPSTEIGETPEEQVKFYSEYLQELNKKLTRTRRMINTMQKNLITQEARIHEIHIRLETAKSFVK